MNSAFGDKPEIQRAHLRALIRHNFGGNMLSFEGALDETVTPSLVDEGHARVDDVDTGHARLDDVDTGPSEPIMVQESPTGTAARMLELAAVTADRLVADAETEVEALVATARAKADAILATSRTEARQVAAELARRKEEQTAELDRERAMAMAGLAEEKAALEARIAVLRQMQNDHRSTMRDHLTEQLSLLDATMPEPPAAVAG
jgi:cell division septum initiation protein DivIVA